MNFFTLDCFKYLKHKYRTKNKFRKEFPSAKWDATKKQWSVGSRSLEKLESWVQANIEKLKADSDKKTAFNEKLSRMVKLTGNTFDLKDILKEKYFAVFHSYTENNIFFSNWYVEPEFTEVAQELINTHNLEKKAQRKAEREAKKYDASKNNSFEENLEILIKLHNDGVDEITNKMPDEFLALGEDALKVTGTVIKILQDHLRFADENDNPEIIFFSQNSILYEKIELIDNFLKLYSLSNQMQIEFLEKNMSYSE